MYTGEVPDTGVRPEHPNPANNPHMRPSLADFLWKAGLGGWVVQVNLDLGTHISGQVRKHWLGASRIPIGAVMVPFGSIVSVEMPVSVSTSTELTMRPTW